MRNEDNILLVPENVLRSFNLSSDITKLRGGQNTSLKVENTVLKPIEEDFTHVEWLLSVVDNINPQGYRLAKPIKSKNGTYVTSNWINTKFEPGEEANGRIAEKLHISKLFHHDLSKVTIDDFRAPNNRWEKAHRVAWQVVDMPKQIHQNAKKIINQLLCKVTRTEVYSMQIIHGDLAGNILFHEKLSPLIIDFSPTIAPREYADAILVCDCIAWQESNVSEIDLLPSTEFYKEMVLRAIIFRLTTAALASGNNEDLFHQEYFAYKPILEYLF
jgi:uncharacterized protein (TIGR02569 family)